MLPSANDLKNHLKALAPTKDASEGIKNFVTVVANFTNQVQAGPMGSAGILTFGNSAMISAMTAMTPVKDSSWIQNFANAWEAGILSAVITPGTVMFPGWIGSGGAD